MKLRTGVWGVYCVASQLIQPPWAEKSREHNSLTGSTARLKSYNLNAYLKTFWSLSDAMMLPGDDLL